MKSVFDRDFVYVRAKDMGPDYLQRKFSRLRKEQRAAEAETARKVSTLPQAKARK